MKNSDVKQGCPIILIHRGYSWYLPYTIRQAKVMNPDSEILLVTDQPRKFLRLFARCVPMGEHITEANEFAKIYTHLSPNEPGFELFCFQRWFVLYSVMHSLGLDHCFYLDSDVLLYSNVTAVRRSYSNADLTVNFEQGPHSTFINRLGPLRGFCDYITKAFTHDTAEMAADYARWQREKVWGGISDMHVLKTYVRNSAVRVADTGQIVEGACFDETIHVSSGFEMRDGIKAIDWRGGKPYARHLATGEMIRFNSLHMQGNSKWRILPFHSRGWQSWLIGVYNRFFK
jgi:hypothetical protein